MTQIAEQTQPRSDLSTWVACRRRLALNPQLTAFVAAHLPLVSAGPRPPACFWPFPLQVLMISAYRSLLSTLFWRSLLAGIRG